MIEAKDFYDHGLALHGHKCPAMPMGLRVGAAALNALGVERAADGQLLALVELGEDHCATCFADGVQMVTGCTFGKGNIQKLHYGKWGVTLVEVATGRAVRVTPRAEAMLANKQTSFFKDYREKGIPASQVPLEVVQPLVDQVMGAPAEQLLSVGPMFDHLVERQLHAFVEIGDDHGGMCFGDGVQYATGCTLGKGNLEKTPYGKLALTLIERATNRAIRVRYKPTLQRQIGASAFMVKRGQGIEPDDIPEVEQMELVNPIWDAPESDVLTLGEVFQFERDWLPEIMGFVPRAACGELTARAYLGYWGRSTCASPARDMSAKRHANPPRPTHTGCHRTERQA